MTTLLFRTPVVLKTSNQPTKKRKTNQTNERRKKTAFSF